MADIQIGNKTFSAEELALAAKMGLLQLGAKNDPASIVPNGNPLQGPVNGSQTIGGTFSYPGVNPDRYSAMMRMRSMAAALGAPRPSNYQTEIFEIMTGVTAETGTNPDDWCGNPTGPGNLKTAQQVVKFGDWFKKTNLNMVPEIGQLRNRADIPGRIVNSAPEENPLLPDLLWRLDNTQSVLQTELFTIGAGLEISLEKTLFQGVQGTKGANGNGWMREFTGLDSWVKTGYTDIVTGVLAPAADSIVLNYNANIGLDTSDGRNFLEAVTETYWSLTYNASGMGMDGVEWAIAMRPEQWRAVVEAWACAYATYRCESSSAGMPVTRDGATVQSLRLEMMNGSYLLIDGMRVRVVLTEGIPKLSQGGGLFSSDIYIIPLNWNGTPLTYLEYMPMDNSYLTEYANAFGLQTVSHINNGQFIVGNRHNGFCLEWLLGMKMRLIMRTPFLAARIDDVQYSSLTRTRTADQSNSFNYVNGGISRRVF
jgi:hypothetical protein